MLADALEALETLGPVRSEHQSRRRHGPAAPHSRGMLSTQQHFPGMRASHPSSEAALMFSAHTAPELSTSISCPCHTSWVVHTIQCPRNRVKSWPPIPAVRPL